MLMTGSGIEIEKLLIKTNPAPGSALGGIFEVLQAVFMPLRLKNVLKVLTKPMVS